MWKKIKGVLIFIGALAVLILGYFLLGKEGGGIVDKAKAARDKADLINDKIAALKAQKGALDEETKKKVDQIRQMDDLDEINAAFDKL
jgi:hypothetical protein